MVAQTEATPTTPTLNSMDDAFDPKVLTFVSSVLDRLTRAYFRFQLRGTHNLPAGKCVVVGNHSGLGIADIACLLGAWPRAFGPTRRTVGLMADSFIKAPVAGEFFLAVGAVPASRENADYVLEQGHSLLVYPGGELDCCRPLHQPRDVVFGSRRGYIRLALHHKVPVVPLATIGSHWTLPMLPGGFLAARLLGARKLLRNERFPIAITWIIGLCGVGLGLAGLIPWWAAVASFLLGISPLPARVTSELMPPIDVAALTAHVKDEDERIELAHRIVHGALQKAVREMEHGQHGASAPPC